MYVRTIYFPAFFLMLFLWAPFSYASHNRAGYITFTHISGFTYQITITTYTDGCTGCADRPYLEISYETCALTADSESIARVNGPDSNGDGVPDGEIIPGFAPEIIKLNKYITLHTYSGPGVYVISVMDPNRNAGVENITSSYDTPFYIQTPFSIPADDNVNSSPIITIPPIYNACVGHPFIYNPGAVDTVEADSISYEIDVCYQDCNDTAFGYEWPDIVAVNGYTGDFVWNAPTQAGLYNFAMKIVEWRDGKRISYILLDMQVVVSDCNNNPPVISAGGPFCVLAGDSVVFDVSVSDPDMDYVTLAATGDPFLTTPPRAQFDSASGYSPVSSQFRWLSGCQHVRKQPYNVYIKAEDKDSVKLIDIRTVSITILAPPPENLIAVPAGNAILLSWDASVCPQAGGYTVYRSEGDDTLSIACPCQNGVPSASGYVPVGTTAGHNAVSFTDNNNGAGLVHGILYCYRITAIFPDGSESCSSPPSCTSLKRDIPIITHVDVTDTDSINGKIYVAWAKPIELDTNQIKGPYKYFIFRSQGFTGSALALIDSLTGLDDTTYTDSGLNTAGSAYSYRIEFYSDSPGNRIRIGFTQVASSVYLYLTPNDNELLLTWFETVPWINEEYEVYKFNPDTGNYLYLATVTDTFYRDDGLVNKREYCYYVRSLGTYGAPKIISPILNRSQQKCGFPYDYTPPCPPGFDAAPDCGNSVINFTWTHPDPSCADDVIGYRVYRTPVAGDLYHEIYVAASSADTVYSWSDPFSIAGCYYATAIDSFYNESLNSSVFCIDNCPVYELPNVFSPDGNGVNDRFIPFPYRYIAAIDIKIFNRWGQPVFSSTDPNIFWDGVNQTTHRNCPSGVYYYICRVDEVRLNGIISHDLTGFIQLIRDTSPGITK